MTVSSYFARGLLAFALALALALGAAGCHADPTKGWSSASTFHTNIRSVAVPIIENDTLVRDVEFELTDALIKEIESRTPYKVTSVSTADTELRGTITRIDQDQLSRRRLGGLPQEMQVSISVDFEWKDLRENETLRDRRGFVAVGRYVPTDPLHEPFELAQHQAVERLASEIVSVMRADW